MIGIKSPAATVGDFIYMYGDDYRNHLSGNKQV